ncbi:MAG: ABC transporter ATP-binding protein [Solirubrobacteraceae bacterium]
MSQLDVSGLKSGYGPIPVLHGVSLEVRAGEIVALVGPNGAGKSTLMKTLFGLLPRTAGTVRYDGQDLDGMKTTELAKLGLGYVPQGGNTFPELSVEDNLRVAAHAMSRAESERALQRVYDQFPILQGLRKRRASLLSGGERQILALAGATVQEPRFLALDEPTTGLAPSIVKGLIEDVLVLSRSGVTVLWVIEENPRQVIQHADRVLVLQAGVISRESPAAELLKSESLEHLFFRAGSEESGVRA